MRFYITSCKRFFKNCIINNSYSFILIINMIKLIIMRGLQIPLKRHIAYHKKAISPISQSRYLKSLPDIPKQVINMPCPD